MNGYADALVHGIPESQWITWSAHKKNQWITDYYRDDKVEAEPLTGVDLYLYGEPTLGGIEPKEQLAKVVVEGKEALVETLGTGADLISDVLVDPIESGLDKALGVAVLLGLAYVVTR